MPIGITSVKDVREKIYQDFRKFSYVENVHFVNRKFVSTTIKNPSLSCPPLSNRTAGRTSIYGINVVEKALKYYLLFPILNRRHEEVRRTSSSDVKVKFPHRTGKDS